VLKKKGEVVAEEATLALADMERQCAAAMDAKAAADTTLAARDAELAGFEASSSGEQARLAATVEQLRTEAMRRTREQEAEREKVKAALTELKRKAERAERARKKAEVGAVESAATVASERDALQVSEMREMRESGSDGGPEHRHAALRHPQPGALAPADPNAARARVCGIASY